MYKISVPMTNYNIKRAGREKLLSEIRRFDADRVFLALSCYEPDEAKKQQALDELADNAAFFKAQGFEVGAWIWTFWISKKAQA